VLNKVHVKVVPGNFTFRVDDAAEDKATAWGIEGVEFTVAGSNEAMKPGTYIVSVEA